MYTIPFLQHDCFWRLLPTMCDCNLVCVLITKHYTVSRWNRLQAKIRHLPKLQQVLCHKLCELWQGLLFNSCRVWRSLFENLHNSNHFVFFYYLCEHLLLLWVSLSEKVFQGPKVVVNRFGWNLAQELGPMRYFKSQFGSLLWLSVLEFQGVCVMFCPLSTKNLAFQGTFWKCHKTQLINCAAKWIWPWTVLW